MKIVLLTVGLLAGLAAGLGAEDAPATGPRAGMYNILSYGAVGRPPLHLGYVEILAGNKYRSWRPGKVLAGEGEYRYDAGARTVTWASGPYKEENWGGEFSADNGGKTHKIRLKRTTVAVNTARQ